MKISVQKRQERAKVIEANKALSASLTGSKTEFTAEEQATFDGNLAKAKTLGIQISAHEAQEALEAEAGASTPAILIPELTGGGVVPPPRTITVPATVSQNSSLKVFKTREQAYKAGLFVAAVVLGKAWAINRVKANQAFDLNALQSEGINTDGGYLVPEEFSAEMIDLREKKGVFRQECRIIPMSRDTFTMGRRVSGLTAYPTAEGVGGTVSTKKIDRVGLVAQKWMVLATMTKELEEDAVIDEAENLFAEMAYALSAAEDDAGFNGDGSGTYSGIVGFKNALLASCKVTQTTSNTWAAQVLADINNLMSKIPDYTVPLNLKFYCNKAYYHQVLSRLAMAAGGVTGTEIVNGVEQGKFFGYPVVFVSSMPRATATTGICCYFGDLARASKMGVRRGVRLERTDQGVVGGVELFTTDEVGLKATERFDIKVHEVGTITSSDAGGPMAALITG